MVGEFLMSSGVVKKVAGPLVVAEGMKHCNMFDVVRVGKKFPKDVYQCCIEYK